MLRGLALGRTRQEIAGDLHLSLHTVRSHLDRSREKLDATTLPHAVARAMGLGLLQLDAA